MSPGTSRFVFVERWEGIHYNRQCVFLISSQYFRRINIWPRMCTRVMCELGVGPGGVLLVPVSVFLN